MRTFAGWRTVRVMIDEEFFEWRDAVLLVQGAPPVDHRVPLANGRPPGQFDRPRGDGKYDRFLLVQNDEACAVYERTGVVERE